MGGWVGHKHSFEIMRNPVTLHKISQNCAIYFTQSWPSQDGFTQGSQQPCEFAAVPWGATAYSLGTADLGEHCSKPEWWWTIRFKTHKRALPINATQENTVFSWGFSYTELKLIGNNCIFYREICQVGQAKKNWPTFKGKEKLSWGWVVGDKTWLSWTGEQQMFHIICYLGHY